MNWLTDIEVEYKSSQREKVNCFLRNYFVQKEINETQLRKYDAKESKEPIIINTKCPISGNILTTCYHFHNCVNKKQPLFSLIIDSTKCEIIPLANLELNCIENKKLNSFLSIQVRNNVLDINHKAHSPCIIS